METANDKDKNLSRVLRSELLFFPPVEWMAQAITASHWQFEVYEHYQKQSWRNRCQILSANGPLNLIVPVKHQGKMPIKEIRIDYSESWVRGHLGAIQSSYGKSPWFEHYFPIMEPLWRKQHVFLLDFQLLALQFCVKTLQLNPQIAFSTAFSEFEPTDTKAEIVDLRGQFSPKKENGLASLSVKPYYQSFGSTFVNGLSILDLLFQQGPASRRHLQNSLNALGHTSV
jgi:hypothetical protein